MENKIKYEMKRNKMSFNIMTMHDFEFVAIFIKFFSY